MFFVFVLCVCVCILMYFYDVNGDMPMERGSVGAAEFISKFLINNVNQCFVDLSSCKQATNVASRN